MRSAFTVQGSRNVTFHYNTVVGNLPSRSYAARLIALGSNQPNEQVKLENNIWSDSSGTMGTEGFIGADVFEASVSDNATSVTLNNNLYYNGATSIPNDSGQAINISDDSNALVDNPVLAAQTGLTLPVWNGSQFNGGFSTISDAFVHLAETYGTPGQTGAGIDQGIALSAPDLDLLGNVRGLSPDLGAVEKLGDDPPIDPPSADGNDLCFPVRHTSPPHHHSLVCF